MNLISKVSALLSKPFPEQESRFGYVRNVVLISLFVGFFLYIFSPFGISELESNKFMICMGFGAMTILGVMAYNISLGFFLQKIGSYNHWTFGKWLIENLVLMIFVSVANFLFARLVIFGNIDWSLFPSMIYGTFMIGIIPIFGLGAYSLLKHEKKYQGIAEEINQKDGVKINSSEFESRTIFDIPLQRIKYVEALQNYVRIAYISVDGTLMQKTERATIKQLEQQSEGSTLTKSHRSYLVNRAEIISTSGNAQGLQLTLSNCDKLIPVSRSNVSRFK